MLDLNAYKSETKPTWCPGCGDFAVLSSLMKATQALQLEPWNIFIASGIGCSSNFPHFLSAFGFHGIHGRSLPVASGAKLANPELTVIAAGGDGDGFGIGAGHFVHTMRRNLDITYIVMDNQIYGLTKGQLSPTSRRGLTSVSSTHGSMEAPVNPLAYVLGYGAEFVAQGTPADMSGLAQIIEEGIRHPGFAFINVQSPCVTYGMEDQQLKAQKASMQTLASINHDPSNILAAMDLAHQYGEKLYTGVLFKKPTPSPTFEGQAHARHQAMQAGTRPRAAVMDLFKLKK